MTTPLHAVPASPAPELDDGLPEAWSDSARATYLEVAREHPDLDAVSLATLYEAVGMLAFADAAQAEVDRDGLVSRGSQGQAVAHPLIAEVRLHRTQALAALRALGLARGQTGASAAGAALAAKRHHGRTAGVRVGR